MNLKEQGGLEMFERNLKWFYTVEYLRGWKMDVEYPSVIRWKDAVGHKSDEFMVKMQAPSLE